MNTWYWRVDSLSREHVRMTLFDPKGANCGNICINARDALTFGKAIEVDWGHFQLERFVLEDLLT
jgi:hypothetical protein